MRKAVRPTTPFDPEYPRQQYIFDKGGAGSGNHGHGGRPGERGGSTPGEGDRDALRGSKRITITPPEQWKKSLTSGELGSIYRYTQSEASYINPVLRAGREKHLQPAAKQTVADLNNMIDRAGVQDEMTVYRGVRLLSSGVNYAPGSQGLLERDVFVNQFEKNIGKNVRLGGFQSTTVDAQVATGFAGPEGNPVFEIKTRRGAPIDGLSSTPTEQEVLLGHNWKYRVADVIRNVPFKGRDGKIKKHTVIRLEAK